MTAVEAEDATHKNYSVHSSQKLKVYFVVTWALLLSQLEILISGIPFTAGPKTSAQLMSC